MDFNDTPEQAKFRKTCRDWLEKKMHSLKIVHHLSLISLTKT